MMIWLKALCRRIVDWFYMPREEELPEDIYIGNEDLKPIKPLSQNKIIFAYRDFKPSGKWYYIHPATQEKIYGGQLLLETVKYIDAESGKIKLGQRILPDNDKHITGFEPTPPEFL
jgi:hypothetical protein